MIGSMLVLSRADVEALLDLERLIDALAAAMTDLSAGRASVPARVAAVVGDRDAFLASMVAYSPAADALAAKLVSVFPQNAGGPRPTHQAVICTFDPTSGEPVAVMDGTYITAMRTAGGSALATRLLARGDAAVMAVLGTGVQARAHARLVSRERRLREIRVAGRDPAAARRLAEDLNAELHAPVVATRTYAEALEGADIACATTHSPEPVVRRRWLSPGVHLNSVGYNPAGREVDDETVADALVIVESRGAALAPFPSGANDLTEPIGAGLIGPGHIRAEIGELLSGERQGRRSPDEITLYKSVGVAVQDAAAAALVLAAAQERGVGRTVIV